MSVGEIKQAIESGKYYFDNEKRCFKFKDKTTISQECVFEILKYDRRPVEIELDGFAIARAFYNKENKENKEENEKLEFVTVQKMTLYEKIYCAVFKFLRKLVN